MLRRIILAALLLNASQSIPHASAMDMATLLAAAKEQPDIQERDLAVVEADLRVTEAYAALFPKINLYGRYENYNSPTPLRPFFPTEGNAARGDSLEFSRMISRYGATAQMPIYVKALYTLADQLKLLKDKAVTAKQIDIVRKEASVVALNSLFTYLVRQEAALKGRETSLSETLAMMERKVASGRAAEAELLKIKKAMNDLAQQHNDLLVKVLDVKRDIRKLTGVELDSPVLMQQITNIQPGDFISLRVLEADVAAAKKDVQRAWEQFYPSLSLEGSLSLNEGTAYNTDRHVERSYNYIAVVLRIPLFDKSLFASKDIAATKVRRSERTLEETRLELSALGKNLEGKAPLLEQSLALAQETVDTQSRLLQIARVAYRNERLTTEEYLRYEADVLQAESSLYQAHNEKWQVISQQAVLYGTELTGVVQ